jgi:SAM-dependent MidA family methyltransferase
VLVTSLTALGMPAVPPPTPHPSWKQAWDAALYGPTGFFRRESPVAHFRTSVHASPLFAQALVRLARDAGLDTVVDIGAGRGELLSQIRALDPGLDLLGVEVAPRPSGLHPAIAWTTALPESVDGLIVANEWLDNIPCHVAEVDKAGTLRMVHVDPTSGAESWGSALTHGSVPVTLREWVERWWPVDRAQPGLRVEIGSSRDTAWADVVARLTHGIAVAIDYGHVRSDRPAYGSIRSYRHGREVDVLPDGSRDLTAHVAVDSVANRVDGRVRTQREVLAELGVSGQRPALALASADPTAYVRRLATATEAAELTAAGGLGDFYWVTSARA